MNSYVWLALAAALALALSALVSKVLLRYRLCNAGLVTWWLVAGTAVVSAAVCAGLRLPFPLKSWPYVIGLAIVLVTSTGVLNKALQDGDASTVVPLLGLKIPFTGIISWLLLKEKISPVLWMAVFLSAGAVALFGAGRQQAAQGGYGRKPAFSIVLAIGAAFLFSVADVSARIASMRIETVTLVLWANMVSAPVAVVMVYSGKYRKYRVGRVDLLLFLLYGALVTVAMWALYYSFTLADSVVLPNVITGTRGLFALFVGYIFSKAAKVPMERQAGLIYAYRAAGTALIVVSLLLLQYSG
jgi:drug/metabolite transporter (DMT)-like permease